MAYRKRGKEKRKMGEENNFGYILAFQSCVDFNVKELDDEIKRKICKTTNVFHEEMFHKEVCKASIEVELLEEMNLLVPPSF